MIELVICDWDGTLMDSQARIVHAMQRAFIEDAAEPPDSAAIREIIGLDLAVAIGRLAVDMPAARIAAIGARYRQAYVAAVHVPSPLFADVPAALAEISAAGILLAVATGKSRAGLDRALAEAGIGHLFAATRTADECAAKPHPEMLHDILAELGVEPAAAMMVGDTTFDLEMASAAAVHAAAVTCGAHSKAQLQRLAPALLLDHFGDLPARLGQFTALSTAARRPSP